uniref:ORF3 and ORF4 n=1 Tax=Wound tumor virus TaxID=10987 RepID=Q89267_WTV|nr:ORF4 [Wound tumor virus]
MRQVGLKHESTHASPDRSVLERERPSLKGCSTGKVSRAKW